MANLYTSLIQAKQELNNGILPPMTPIPENVQHFIDPEFTPGLGALEEDLEKGVRCPVKGCGKYWQRLRTHLDRAHNDIGGARLILQALSIPERTPLDSQRLLASNTERGREIAAAGKLKELFASGRRASKAQQKGSKSYTEKVKSVNHQNLTNTCEAQIAHRMWDLYHMVGRSPSTTEARILLGNSTLQHACDRLYGSWNAAKAAIGMNHLERGNQKQQNKEWVVEALRAWCSAHGSLPRRVDAQRPTRVPLIPGVRNIQKAFETADWPVAMRRAAINLGIYDVRYNPKPGTKSIAQLYKYTRANIIEVLVEFYQANGYLPAMSKCRVRGGNTVRPSAVTIMKYLGTRSWPDAMCQVAEHLDIYDARYRPRLEEVTA